MVTVCDLRKYPIKSSAGSEGSLGVSAPAQSDLKVSLGHDGQRATATVWGDRYDAIEVGDLAAGWFPEALSIPCCLVAFDEWTRRNCDPEFVWPSGASTQFSDGCLLLVIGETSLTALNERLIERARYRFNGTLSSRLGAARPRCVQRRSLRATCRA